eukprot:TRINITY_DN2154_c2_g4_i3.p1 TRINITY_DN2154_c2_g4~~TRINITY_DN2154_c2_g4_i3.p1  ORF type:complete len:183 (-),score=27.27 TRINITY_DN2154_c2_g4_i3:336-824(-)
MHMVFSHIFVMHPHPSFSCIYGCMFFFLSIFHLTDRSWFQDHLALMMELLGKIPRKIAIGGSRSKDLFDRHGDLKRIRRLKYWPLDRLLVEKYKFSETDACEFSEFLLPILDFAPEKRPTAAQCSQHPWLKSRSAKLNDGNNVEGLDKLESGMNQLQLKMPK